MVIQPVLEKFRSRHPRPTILPAAMEHILCCSTDSQSLGPILPYLMHSVLFGFECSCSGWEYTTNSPAHSTKSTSSLGVLGLSCNSLSSLLWRSKTALYSTKQNLYQQKPLSDSSLAPRFYTDSFFPCKRCFRINLYAIIARSLSLSAFSRSTADICFRFLVLGGLESSVLSVCLSFSVFLSVSCEIREWRSSGFVPWKRITRQNSDN